MVVDLSGLTYLTNQDCIQIGGTVSVYMGSGGGLLYEY